MFHLILALDNPYVNHIIFSEIIFMGLQYDYHLGNLIIDSLADIHCNIYIIT